MTPQHPAAPETETDANGLTEAEVAALRRCCWPLQLPTDMRLLVERIVAERVRVVEGERDAAQLALGEQADIEREAFGRGVEWASGAGMRRGWEAAESRATTAEQQLVKAMGDRDVLAKAMWDVRASFGFDTDGDKKYHSDDYLEVARSFISDMAEALDDLRKEISSADQDGWGRGFDAATARAESAEAAHEAEKAAHERLRAGVWALGESIHGDEGVEHVEGCEGEPTCFACILDTLRSLLGGGEAR